MEFPVTLVIKAPNQRIEDQTIECGLEWTIKKLKQHLSSVYPNKPEEDNQKIIYSGKLLANECILKDVLRKDNEATAHTVHLVCSEYPDTPPVTPVTRATPSPNNDGIRQRLTAASQQHSNTSQPGYVQAPSYAAPPMAPFSPEQMLWMQQAYAQQMQQYMHYYQQQQQQQFQEVTSQAGVAQRPRARAPADPPVQRMNAQGGMWDAGDEEDDERLHRDWLDWLYILCRLLVLFSIVYFYSNLGRFALVVSIFVFIYLYQTGWFSLRRRVPQRPVQEAPVNAAAPEPAAAPLAEEPVVEAAEGAPGNMEISEDAPTEAARPEPRPSVIGFVWTFVSTFFSSLFPNPPPRVNAN